MKICCAIFPFVTYFLQFTGPKSFLMPLIPVPRESFVRRLPKATFSTLSCIAIHSQVKNKHRKPDPSPFRHCAKSGGCPASSQYGISEHRSKPGSLYLFLYDPFDESGSLCTSLALAGIRGDLNIEYKI